MKNNISKHWILLLFTTLIISVISNAQSVPPIQTQFLISKSGTSVWIKASVANNSEKRQTALSYELVLINSSPASCKILQSGSITIPPEKTITLLKQKIKKNNKVLKYVLIIREKGQILSKKSLMVYDRKNFNKTNSAAVFSDRGISFCKYLDRINNYKTFKYPFEITIEEKALNNHGITEISIVINNHQIYKFKALSKPAYLLAAAQESDRKIAAYLATYSSSLLAAE